MANHIAVVSSKFKSCFINGSPASVEQEINYGTVIETYNIDIGLQESFKSGESADSGMLKLFWPETGQSSGIRSFCKVIFKSSGKKPGPDTVLLDPKSKMVTLYKPTKKKESIARVMSLTGDVMLKPAGSSIFSTVVKPGFGINNGDSIRTGETGFAVIIYIDDRSVVKIRDNTEFQFIDTPSTRTIDIKQSTLISSAVDLVFDIFSSRGTKTFIVSTPVSVAGVKG